MKIVSATQRRLIDSYTIKNEPISSHALMERASNECFRWIVSRFDKLVPIFILVGKGNNGGDGLALARMLAEVEFNIVVLIPISKAPFSPDAQKNLLLLQEQKKASLIYVNAVADIPLIPENAICIDALFGSGLNRPIEGLLADCILKLNSVEAIKIAIDISSGLPDEQCVTSDLVVFKADYTLTFEFPFLSFFFADNEQYVGEWHLLSIGLHPLAIFNTDSTYKFVKEEDIKSLLRSRSKFSHKGTFGHALLIAGSKGMAGASVLAARACLHSGVGMLTVHGPAINYQVLQTAVPEAMFSVDVDEKYFSQLIDIQKYSAVAVGPGLGKHIHSVEAFSGLVETCVKPLVIDADGINILSINKLLLNKLPADTIITPHPGEFDRLVGVSETGAERLQKAIEFAQKYKIYIVLKGAYTATITPGGLCYYNSTGNPGMATAGSGDVLTGIIVGLLAQKYTPLNSCLLGVYLHGLSGDIAAQNLSQQALTATSIVENIGSAYKVLLE